ncbi:hypothetical protein SAMN04488024_11019 [Pedobacter soli]|uniref:Uncharacterized protein n=1 Tax=Pedobacter soli TaxID=390242 RepID=A0A1G6Z892_9SPHI|nr:hypothetical protein SAMN04488024_11019 [Pedobacter soli]
MSSLFSSILRFAVDKKFKTPNYNVALIIPIYSYMKIIKKQHLKLV